MAVESVEVPPRILICAALAGLAAAGCGGGGEVRPAARATATPGATATPRPGPRAAGSDAQRRVIEDWADSLARSDVDRATSYFALPVVVEQGRAFRLRTRAQVRIFNDGLPCGAKLLSVSRERGFVVGTFRLEDRPGSRCDAPGGTARVALRFKGRRFSEWHQLPDAPSAPDAPSSAT